MNDPIVIVGGGLSGLSLAYRVRQRLPGRRVVVLEKRPTPGGNIGTRSLDGFRFEQGPNGIFDAKPHTLDLCRELGLGDRLIAASEVSRKNRFLFLNGRLQILPGSLMSFLASPVMSWRAKWRLLTEKYRRRPKDVPDDESVDAFARRRVGGELAESLVDAFVTGIHAADPALLSLPAAFPRVAQFEKQYGSVSRGFAAARKEKRLQAQARGEEPQPQRMWSFREGLQVLIDALRDHLGSSIVTGVNVRRIEKVGEGWRIHAEGRDSWNATTVVLTAHAPEQAGMLADLDPALSAEVAGIPYNRIAVAVVGFREADVPRRDLQGFGYLVPQRDRRDVLGVQWCSSIFPDRAPNGMVMWRVLCGGWHRGEMVDWSDDRLIQAVCAELRLSSGVAAVPVLAQVVRWPMAIPQYHVGHLARVMRIEAMAEKHPGLYLAGNAYHGVAMNDCVEQADIVARRVAGHVD